MSIKFKCPHCQKALSVKDEFAGKRAKCSGCQKIVTIPAPVSQPADVEDFAASAFTEAPKAAEPPKETKTVDFNCPQCDAELHLSADLAGKQSQCPECGRIIKVPQLVKTEPKDWRTAAQQRGPSGALGANQPEPEGAWGSATSAGKVSRQALLEADVLPQEREKLTVGQWVKRGVLVAAGLGMATVAVLLVLHYRGQSSQKQAVAKALELAAADNTKSSDIAGEVHRGAGEWYLRTNNQEDSKEAEKQFAEARATLARLPASAARDYLLMELALTQVELGGEGLEVQKHIRLGWDKALPAINQSLENLPAAEAQKPGGPPTAGARVVALREVCLKLLAKGEAKQVPSLALPALPPDDPLRPEAVAQVGLLLAAGNPDLAGTLAENALGSYRKLAANKEAKVPAMTPALVTLCLVLGKQDELLPKLGDKPADATLIGYAASYAYQGKGDEARATVSKQPSPFLRLQAFVAMAAAAEAGKQPGEIAEDVKAAVEILESQFKGQAVAPWAMIQLARVGARAGQGDQVRKAAGLLVDAGTRGLVQLEALWARLQETKGKADDGWAEDVDKQTVAHALAREYLARHDANHGGLSSKTVDAWDEAVKPLGYIGLALGLQDKEK